MYPPACQRQAAVGALGALQANSQHLSTQCDFTNSSLRLIPSSSPISDSRIPKISRPQLSCWREWLWMRSEKCFCSSSHRTFERRNICLFVVVLCFGKPNLIVFAADISIWYVQIKKVCVRLDQSRGIWFKNTTAALRLVAQNRVSFQKATFIPDSRLLNCQTEDCDFESSLNPSLKTQMIVPHCPGFGHS